MKQKIIYALLIQMFLIIKISCMHKQYQTTTEIRLEKSNQTIQSLINENILINNKSQHRLLIVNLHKDSPIYSITAVIEPNSCITYKELMFKNYNAIAIHNSSLYCNIPNKHDISIEVLDEVPTTRYRTQAKIQYPDTPIFFQYINLNADNIIHRWRTIEIKKSETIFDASGIYIDDRDLINQNTEEQENEALIKQLSNTFKSWQPSW